MKIQPFYKLLIILVIFSFSACQQQTADDGSVDTAFSQMPNKEQKEAQMALAGIEIGQAEKRSLSDYIECTGIVEVPPPNLASVSAPINGFVKEIKYLEGDYVKKGGILTYISHPDLVHLQQQFLESKSRLAYLKKTYDRLQQLTQEDAAAQKKLEEAEAEYKVEKSRYAGFKAEIGLIGLNPEQIEADETIKTVLPIYAPISGYMAEVNVNLGKLVTPEVPMFKMIDNSHLHLELQVFAKDINRIQKGQRVTFTVPGKDQYWEAEIFLVGKMIDPETKTAMVHTHFIKALPWLTPGTYVQAKIFLEEEIVLAVPESALVRSGANTYVFVQTEDGFQKIEVMTGRTDGDYIEIKSQRRY